MTLMMDGVGRRASVVQPMPVITPKLKPAQPRLAENRLFVVGMDGIRRPVAAPMTPREVVANIQAPAAAELPTWHMPPFAWKRPVAAFGLVATALVASGVTAHALATPHTVTAHADSAHTQTTAPAPAKLAPAVAAPVPHKTGLQQILNDFVAANGDTFGIVVKDMKTGETATINPDKQIASASLYKLFVAQRIYQQIDIGQLDYSRAAGGDTGRNVDQCLTVMINISDNACGRALGTILGWDNQDQALKLEGYKGTTLATPQQTSAGDVAMLFSRLYNGTLVSPNSTQRFTDLLKSQSINNRLPVGLPAGTVIAHKTGDLDGVVHDAGIVYGPKTDFVVVATSGPWSTPGDAPAMFADLSAKLWNYFEQ